MKIYFPGNFFLYWHAVLSIITSILQYLSWVLIAIPFSWPDVNLQKSKCRKRWADLLKDWLSQLGNVSCGCKPLMDSHFNYSDRSVSWAGHTVPAPSLKIEMFPELSHRIRWDKSKQGRNVGGEGSINVETEPQISTPDSTRFAPCSIVSHWGWVTRFHQKVD